MSRRNNSTKNSVSMRFVINFMSFIAAAIIGIVLIISKLNFASKIASILMMIAQSLAYLIVIFAGFYYARSKRSIWYLIVWAASTILIITYYFI